MAQFCSNCGAPLELIYRIENAAFVCAHCGNVVETDSQALEKRKKLEIAIAEAEQFIRVGRFSEGFEKIYPFQKDYPTDSRVSKFILRALTNDFTGINICNKNQHKAALDAWNALERITGIDPEMAAYRDLIGKMHQRRTKKMIFEHIAVILLAAVVAALISAHLHELYALTYGSMFGCAVWGIIALKKDVFHIIKRVVIRRRLGSNPFNIIGRN